MAWPKKGTRKIVVCGETYNWHYNAHCLWCSEDVFTVGKEGQPYVLFIDPFPFGEEIRPANVARSVQWAVSEGWSPENGPTRTMALDDEHNEFVWLKENQRHLSCLGKAPDNL